MHAKQRKPGSDQELISLSPCASENIAFISPMPAVIVLLPPICNFCFVRIHINSKHIADFLEGSSTSWSFQFSTTSLGPMVDSVSRLCCEMLVSSQCEPPTWEGFRLLLRVPHIKSKPCCCFASTSKHTNFCCAGQSKCRYIYLPQFPRLNI